MIASKIVPNSVESPDSAKNIEKMVKHATSKFLRNEINFIFIDEMMLIVTGFFLSSHL